MSPRDDAGQRRPEAEPPIEPTGAEATVPTGGEVAGLNLAGAEATRGGEDARRRGWFWHWNSIVTQYAPLLGLKGVGLLNSYTVWTDRREESPHRGYAFPSQQSEADFYGEDRAELITINKILVALDLIEIRKEMVLRADERGRRWRVPHNFYRVKDHADGFGLTARDVLRVVELADRDKTVYRYVRRIFSPRFAPIDHDNVWHRILPELRRTEPWQRLATRAAAEEDRASARTRAGHAARKTGTTPDLAVVAGPGTPEGVDAPATSADQNDTERGAFVTLPGTSVATTNRGSSPDVDGANNGSTAESMTSVGRFNEGVPTAVAPANTTYDQSGLTTTTTHDGGQETDSVSDNPTGSIPLVVSAPLANRHRVPHPEGGIGHSTVTQPPAAGPGERPAPDDGPGEVAAVRAFEEANARPASPAERKLLRGLAERFDPAARAANASASGWEWIAAAAYEAVEAGSAFVAPRRLREILARWERDGFPADPTATPHPSRETRTGAERRPTRRQSAASTDTGPSPVDLLGSGPDVTLPHGHGSRRTWAFAVGLLAGALDRPTLTTLVAGTAIVGYRDGEVTVAAPDAAQAERLATTHRDLVARKLSEAMRRPVRLAVLVADSSEANLPADASTPTPASPVDGPADDGVSEAEPAIPSFVVAECGLPSGQVWSAVLAEVAAGDIGRANFDAWLRATILLGRAGDGDSGSALVVGVAHALAQRRVAARFGPHLRAAVAAVVGVPLPIEVVVARDWLLAPSRPSAARDESVPETTMRRA